MGFGSTWTEKEINFLVDNHLILTYEQIGAKINKSKDSVRGKYERLGLHRNNYIEPKIEERYGKLIVKEFNGIDSFGYKTYKCLCDCGKFTTVKGTSLKAKFRPTKSCGCLRQWARKDPGESCFRYLYVRYVKGSKIRTRNFEFLLTYDEFKAIISMDCFYCAVSPRPWNRYVKIDGKTKVTSAHRMSPEGIERSWVNVNGIDRVDNKNGYLISNCVPSCFNCNHAKGDMNLDEWLAFIERFQPGFTKKILKKLEKAGINIPKGQI